MTKGERADRIKTAAAIYREHEKETVEARQDLEVDMLEAFEAPKRERMSHAELAEASGFSRSRVRQLIRQLQEARDRG